MTQDQINNPLHGITLETLLTQLVSQYGWGWLAERLPINCFLNEPSIKSSLAFLRKTHWARQKIEAIYLASQDQDLDSLEAPDEARKVLSRPRAATRHNVRRQHGSDGQRDFPRGERRFDRSDRPQGEHRFDRGDRPQGERGFNHGDRPQGERSFNRGDRPQGERGFNRGERPQGERSFNRGERPARQAQGGVTNQSPWGKKSGDEQE